jgi:hypothetical protein
MPEPWTRVKDSRGRWTVTDSAGIPIEVHDPFNRCPQCGNEDELTINERLGFATRPNGRVRSYFVGWTCRVCSNEWDYVAESGA